MEENKRFEQNKNIVMGKKDNILQAVASSSLVLLFLVGIILLNIDLKRTYQFKLRLITICEESAKEGAFYLLDGMPKVRAIVNNLIEKSGVSIDNVLIEPLYQDVNTKRLGIPKDLVIAVFLNKKIKLISGAILGFSHQEIHASAIAFHQPIQKLWQFNTKAHVHSSPVICNGILYCGVAGIYNGTSSLAGFMYAFDTKTGRKLWSFDTSSNLNKAGCCIQSKPVVVDGTVYFTIVNAENNPDRFTYLYALDAKTGLPKWDAPTLISNGYGREDYIWHNSSPAIFKNTCYVGVVDGKFYAIDIKTGEIIDTYTTRGSIISSPLISDGIVYFGSNDGKLRALTITDSGKLELKWAYPWTGSLGSIRCKPTIFDKKVYFTAGKYDIYAVDTESEELCWVYDTSKQGNKETTNTFGNFDILSSPAIEITSSGEKLIHLGNGDGVAFCLKENNNEIELKWKQNLGIKIEADPIISNGIVYYGVKHNHYNGCLFALRTSDGTILQKYYIKNNIRSNPIIYNNTLYFGGCDSNIHAIKTVNLPLSCLVE
ncbi:MAG: PQQ-binding-like beta-propeller repeat protein [bacterium]